MRTLPHRNYELQVRTGRKWDKVLLLSYYTRKEAEDELKTYEGCNPGDKFRLVVSPSGSRRGDE